MSEIGYKCPTCHKTKCGIHCNHCGSIIYWTGATKSTLGISQKFYIDEKGSVRNKETNSKRALNYDGSLHFCMLRGTKDGKFRNLTKLKEEQENKDEQLKLEIE